MLDRAEKDLSKVQEEREQQRRSPIPARIFGGDAGNRCVHVRGGGAGGVGLGQYFCRRGCVGGGGDLWEAVPGDAREQAV
jgi:hypothetical protein